MDNRSLRALEFHPLLDFLKDFSISPLGKKRCLALTPTPDRSLIESRLTEVIELKEIFKTLGDIPLRGLKDIEDRSSRFMRYWIFTSKSYWVRGSDVSSLSRK
jgi:dsDNA-specific endonuclease/ATPase MutS2